MSRFNPAADTVRSIAGVVAAVFLAGTCLTAAAGPAKAQTSSAHSAAASVIVRTV